MSVVALILACSIHIAGSACDPNAADPKNRPDHVWQVPAPPDGKQIGTPLACFVWANVWGAQEHDAGRLVIDQKLEYPKIMCLHAEKFKDEGDTK